MFRRIFGGRQPVQEEPRIGFRPPPVWVLEMLWPCLFPLVVFAFGAIIIAFFSISSDKMTLLHYTMTKSSVEVEYETIKGLAQQEIIQVDQIEPIWRFLTTHRGSMVTTEAGSNTTADVGASITSMLYSVGTLILSVSAGYLTFVFWHHGAIVAAIALMYAILFYYAATLVVSSTPAVFVGGLLYFVPVLLAPIVTLGVLKATGYWVFAPIQLKEIFSQQVRHIFSQIHFRSIRSIIVHLALASYFFLIGIRSTLLPDFLRLSVLLQLSVCITAYILYTISGFPLLQIPLITAFLFLLVTIVELSPVSVRMVQRGLQPTWLWTTISYGVVCTCFVLMDPQHTYSFGLSTVGSCILSFGLPFVFVVWITRGAFLTMSSTEILAQIPPRLELHGRTLHQLLLYTCVHFFLLFLSIRVHIWAFIPTALFGLIISLAFFICSSIWLTCIYKIIVGGLLLVFSLALENVHDQGHAALFAWIRESNNHWTNLSMRTAAVITATYSIIGVPAAVYPLVNPRIVSIAAYIFVLTQLCGFVNTFCALEPSTLLASMLSIASTGLFLWSLRPLVAYLLPRERRHPVDHDILAIFVIYMLSMRMLIFSTISGNEFGVANTLITLLGNQVYAAHHEDPLVSLYFSAVIGFLQGFSCIVSAVLVAKSDLAFYGIMYCYTAIAIILYRYSRDATTGAIVVTLLGLFTIHFGLAFQQYYSALETIVLAFTPAGLLDWIDPTTKVVGSSGYEIAIDKMVKWISAA